jgi:hypothetical protein
VPLRDATELTPAQREKAGLRFKSLKKILDPPDLAWFNTAPCEKHQPDPHPLCPGCGIIPRDHQWVGAMFMYAGLPGLLSDTVGPQPLDARVLTPGGWVLMGDLQPGTQVVDPDGDLSRVAEVIPQGVQDVYRITFSDGTWAESTLGHLWEVRSMTGDRLRYKTRVSREQRDLSPWKVRSLGEIRDLKGQYAVPLIRRPPDFAAVGESLPVDPYLLGLLLGDGSLSKHTPEFGSADPELLEAAEKLRPAGWGWMFAQDRTGCRWYRLNGSQPVLRELGLFGKRSWEKSVPGRYRWSAAEDRLALLQGLMDTDGSWAVGTGADFGSSSRQLAEDVAELGRSLGLRTSRVRERKTSYTYRGERREGRPCWRVTVAPAPGMELFRLSRKLKAQPRQRVHGDLANAGKRVHWQRDQRVKWIRAIEYSRTAPVQCIRVTAPSQLYVTDGWTVTHNSGKTAQALMLLAMCKQMGELSYDNRAVIITQPAALDDPWAIALKRLTPGLDVIIADGPPEQRRRQYAGRWEVCVVSSRTFTPAGGSKRSRPGDVALIEQAPVGILIGDDVDELRSPRTRTWKAFNRLARQVPRVHVLHATPLQKRLMELWAFLFAVGGASRDRLGPEERCRQRYVTQTRKIIAVPDPGDPTGRKRTRRAVWVDNGITRNLALVAEFRERIAPIVLRRTAADLTDVTLPEIQVNQVWVDLLPEQRRRYEQLREGTLRRLTSGGEVITQAVAAAAFTRGQQICGGLASLDDGPGSDVSAKLDWVMRALTGDLAEEKVICFVHHKGNVRALSQRLREEKIGHVLMWSEMTDKRRRAERLRLFREDPRARVLVGTTSIKTSLNLQVARHLIAVDTILNPAGMEQLTGRTRRQGSPYPMVFLHHLLAPRTQETAYPALLRREQEVADVVWDEQSDLRWVLAPRQLMGLVAYGELREAP